jgi:hypothetical protein
MPAFLRYMEIVFDADFGVARRGERRAVKILLILNYFIPE